MPTQDSPELFFEQLHRLYGRLTDLESLLNKHHSTVKSVRPSLYSSFVSGFLLPLIGFIASLMGIGMVGLGVYLLTQTQNPTLIGFEDDPFTLGEVAPGLAILCFLVGGVLLLISWLSWQTFTKHQKIWESVDLHDKMEQMILGDVEKTQELIKFMYRDGYKEFFPKQKAQSLDKPVLQTQPPTPPAPPADGAGRPPSA